MAAKVSTYLKRLILNKVLNNVDFVVRVGPMYMSLHAGDPGDNGANEITGYSRVIESIWVEDSPSTGRFANNDDLVFGPITAGSVTLTHVGLWDLSTGGNFLWSAPLQSSLSIVDADSVAIASGSVIAQLVEC